MSARDRDALHRTIERFAAQRVAILADLVVDEFVHGDIARVSREAPVLILDHRSTEFVPGGGANAVANVAALGAQARPVGVVGRDEAGERLIETLEARGVTVRGIVSRSAWITPTKSRVVAGGIHTRRQQLVRVDRGTRPGSPLDARLAAALDRAARAAARTANGVLVADYGYGVATPDRAGIAHASLRNREAPVTVDSRSRIALYRGLSACTPNHEELELAYGRGPLVDERSVRKAGRAVLEKTGHAVVLVTRGSKGMTLFSRDGSVSTIPAYGTDEVADVTGAGDTVVATFTLALMSGATALDAARIANAAAGIVVMKAGTATITTGELHAAIDEGIP